MTGISTDEKLFYAMPKVLMNLEFHISSKP